MSDHEEITTNNDVVWISAETPPELLEELQVISAAHGIILSSVIRYCGWRNGKLISQVRYDMSFIRHS